MSRNARSALVCLAVCVATVGLGVAAEPRSLTFDDEQNTESYLVRGRSQGPKTDAYLADPAMRNRVGGSLLPPSEAEGNPDGTSGTVKLGHTYMYIKDGVVIMSEVGQHTRALGANHALLRGEMGKKRW